MDTGPLFVPSGKMKRGTVMSPSSTNAYITSLREVNKPDELGYIQISLNLLHNQR